MNLCATFLPRSVKRMERPLILGLVEPDETYSLESSCAAWDVPLETDCSSLFWGAAQSVVADRDLYGRPIGEYKTEIRFGRTQRILYVLFVYPFHKLHLKSHPNTSQKKYCLWNWDVAERFIGWDVESNRGVQKIRGLSAGRMSRSGCRSQPSQPYGWDGSGGPGNEVSARIEPKAKAWYAAIRIPLSYIDDQLPVLGRRFRLNLFCCQGPPQSGYLIERSSPMQDSFHVPERFTLAVERDAGSIGFLRPGSSIYNNCALQF